jgi:anti-sigma factor RsiW
MACESPRELLERYAADDLPLGAMTSVEAHVARCPECAESLHGLLSLGPAAEAALELLPPEPPTALKTRVNLLLPPQDVSQSDTCYSLGVQMSAFLDGELSADEEADLRGHVASCAPCERELGRLRHLQVRMSRLNVRPRHSLVKRLRHVARRTGVPAFRPVSMQLKLRPSFVGAFAVAVTAAVVFAAGYHLGALRVQTVLRHQRPVPVALGTPGRSNAAGGSAGTRVSDVPGTLAATNSTPPTTEVVDDATVAFVAPAAPDSVVSRATGSVRQLVNSGAHLMDSLHSVDSRGGTDSKGRDSTGRGAAGTAVPTGGGGARATTGEPSGAAGATTGPSTDSGSNRADEGLRLIERAWSSVVPAATGANSDGGRAAKAARDPVVVDAVTVAGTPAPGDDEFEPSASASLY